MRSQRSELCASQHKLRCYDSSEAKGGVGEQTLILSRRRIICEQELIVVTIDKWQISWIGWDVQFGLCADIDDQVHLFSDV